MPPKKLIKIALGRSSSRRTKNGDKVVYTGRRYGEDEVTTGKKAREKVIYTGKKSGEKVTITKKSRAKEITSKKSLGKVATTSKISGEKVTSGKKKTGVISKILLPKTKFFPMPNVLKCGDSTLINFGKTAHQKKGNVTFNPIEEAVFEWYQKSKNSQTDVTKGDLQVAALRFARVFNQSNFTASEDWVRRFIESRCIKVSSPLKAKRNLRHKVPDGSDHISMDGAGSSGQQEDVSNYLTCAPLISSMAGIQHGASDVEDMEASPDDFEAIDVKSEPIFAQSEMGDNDSHLGQQSGGETSQPPSPAPGLSGPYLLKKDAHCNTILDQLLKDQDFTDVTLTAEGHSIRAHKIVLCLASNYFRQVLNKESNVQSVVVFRDIKFDELKSIINFVYTGEATVDAAELESFMKTAEMLEISSLCESQKMAQTSNANKTKAKGTPEPKERNETTDRPSKSSSKRSLASSSSTSGSPNLKSRKVNDSASPTKKHKLSQPGTSSDALYSPDLTLVKEELDVFEPEEPELSEQPSKPPDRVGPTAGICPFCPSNSSLIIDGPALKTHVLSLHQERKAFVCEKCAIVFQKKGAFEAHQPDCGR